MKAYKVYDVLLSSYWTSPKGKSVWLKAGNAKNAWNVGGRSPINFNHPEQKRFIIHEFDLIFKRVV